MRFDLSRVPFPALTLAAALLISPLPAAAQDQTAGTEAQALGIALEGFEYPHPVHFLPLTAEGQDVRMAYMDVKPSGNPDAAPAVVLFHGKNFFGEYWRDTIAALTQAGFRVVVPDQIGFGKSSKPDIRYSFHQMAAHTRRLLETLGIDKTAVVGHSMGGMAATRFALMYPDVTTRLVLENPIGLEDYRTSVPYTPTEEHYRDALNATREGIRKYHATYYVEWKPEYEKYVDVHYRWTLGGEAPRLAWVSALTTQMIYEQPVVHQFPEVQVPTLLVIGQEDRTVVGRGKVKPEDLNKLGQYPKLGKAAAAAIPNAKLVELENVGHIPHFEAPERFHRELIEFLKSKGD